MYNNHSANIQHFDVHVYFTEDTRSKASTLRDKVLAELKHKASYVGSLIDRKVGPHPMPMFEFHFAPNDLSEVLLWLMAERTDLNILVHQVTGHDFKDHSQGAIWLGQSLPLDFSKLDPSP